MNHVLVRARSLVSVFVGLGLAAASPADASKCEAGKLKATGKLVAAQLSCHAQAVRRGTAVDPACSSKADERFLADFAKAESLVPPCSPGDAPAIDAEVDAAVASITTLLGGPGPSLCTQQKLQAAGRKALQLHACYAAPVAKTPEDGVNVKCLDRADAKLAKAFEKAETKGDCITGTGDAGDVAELIDALLTTTSNTLAPPIVNCEPLMVTATHGAGPFFDHTMLARIEDGKVPCVQIEEPYRTRKCEFSTASGSESGDWVETTQGDHARSGQAISPQGVPGGDYVIGTRISDDGTMPCVEPVGGDSTGTTSATPATGACTREIMSSSRNAGGPLVNFATQTVCTSSDPHPDQHGEDGLESKPNIVIRQLEDPPFYACWDGEGAGLNDRWGRERDENGVYYPQANRCHLVQLNRTYAIWAAKRPQTSGLQVLSASPLLWRPVAPVPNIAN